jgi:soluble lytic murein transglycosylase-like protein
MSTPAVVATDPPAGLDAAAAVTRVQQLQQLIAAARGGGAAPTPAGGFAAALATAAAAPTATTAASAATAAAPAAAGSGSSSAYDGLIAAAANRYGIDPALLHGLIQQESGFDPNARSSAGALGLTQLMPDDIRTFGVSNPFDPAQSIDAGARQLRQDLDSFGGNVVNALAAYNAGPNAVRHYGGVPPYPETQDYVRKVLGYADAYRQPSGAALYAPPA